MRLIVSYLALSLSLVSGLPAAARDPQLDVGGFREEDRPVAEAIAGFDASDRHAALVASGHPEKLLAMSQIQRRSSEQFAKLIEGLSREEQEKVWEIVRQPGLVADLARGGAKSESEIDAIAARHPEAIRPLVRSEGGKRYSTWVEVFAIDLEAERAFADVVAKQPSGVKEAFVRLRGRPDLTTILVDNVGVATRIGAAYRADPTRVEARFDDLSHDVKEKRSADSKSWSNELADPKARESLQSTAQTFAKDHGYDLDDPNDPSNTRPAQTQVVYVNTNSNPYPYWYGYPSWYAYPYWYPATVWTHLGFRYGAGGTFIGFGMPSPYFLGWYNNVYAGYGYGYGGYGGYGYGLGFGGYPGWGYSRGPGYGYWGGYPGYGYGGGWGGGRHRSHHSFNSGNYYSHHYPRVFEGNRQLPSSGGSPGGFVRHHGHHGNSGGGPVVFGNGAPNGGQIGHHGNRGHHGNGGGFNGGGQIGHHGNRGHHGGFGGGGGMGGGGFGGGGFGGGGGGGHGGGGHHR